MVYSTIISNYSTDFHDDMYAGWRTQYNNAFLSDSSYGSIYDSCMYAYTTRLLDDITRIGSSSPRIPEIDINNNISGSMSKILLVQPNPFSDKVDFQYYLGEKTYIELEIIDIFGVVVTILLKQEKSEGWHTFNYEGSKLLNGIYFLRLRTPEYSETIKIMKVD